MKKLIATLTAALMLCVLVIAMLLIIFPQQWKETIYPSVSQILPDSVRQILPEGNVSNQMCDNLEANLQNFANYLKNNQDIVDVKGMYSLDEQLARIQFRVDAMPSEVRNVVCQQEYARLEGLKSVFFLGGTT